MDEYLKLLLEQIRCTKARPYIKQELQDHMEDQIAENMKAGMDHEQAEKEAVRDMGDPVETGISLDSIHRPQAAWKLLGMIIFISIAGVLIHAGISGKASENAAAGSDRYVFHVMIGLAVMMILYLLDWACPTGKRPRPAGPPMPTCWKSCGTTRPSWRMCCATGSTPS